MFPYCPFSTNFGPSEKSGKGTTPLAMPVMGSNPPKPLTDSDAIPPFPLNCPRVAGNLCACVGESLTVCCGFTVAIPGVRFGAAARFGIITVGSPIFVVFVEVGEVAMLVVAVPLVELE